MNALPFPAPGIERLLEVVAGDAQDVLQIAECQIPPRFPVGRACSAVHHFFGEKQECVVGKLIELRRPFRVWIKEKVEIEAARGTIMRSEQVGPAFKNARGCLQQDEARRGGVPTVG
ncbi:MAG: hypothetical protein WCH98_01435 [Verrucomicrobiota bacterium]